MKTGIPEYIARWRHTRGYGVHSPLAYRIATDCIRPGREYAMYADDSIDEVFGSDKKKRKQAHLLIRLINILRPRKIWISGADRKLTGILRKTFPSVQVSDSRVCPGGTDFIAVFGNADICDMWRKLDNAEEACMAVFTDSEETPEADCGNPPTLTMTGRKYRIIIRRPGMAPVAYDML